VKTAEPQLEWSAGPLPSGRHGLSREYVLASQRTRLLGAAIQVAGTDGYAAMTVSAVTQRAGISRKTFYELFSDREDCFLATYDHVLTCVLRGMRQAYDAQDAWPAQLRAALAWLLETLASRPHEARVAFVEAFAAGPKPMVRRARAMRELTPLLEPGYAAAPASVAIPRLLPEATVGALQEVIAARVVEGRTRELPALLPDLLYCALAPFLGPVEAAALAAGKPAPRRRHARV
jgi:AcrR family transcriptional regulator